MKLQINLAKQHTRTHKECAVELHACRLLCILCCVRLLCGLELVLMSQHLFFE